MTYHWHRPHNADTHIIRSNTKHHLPLVRHRLSSGKNQSHVAISFSDMTDVHMSMLRTPTVSR